MMLKYSSNKKPYTLGQSRRTLGFTIIELMIVLAVLATFLTVAVPSFTQLINNNRSQAVNQELLGLFNYARSVAVQQRTTAVICPSANIWSVKIKDCASGEELKRMNIAAGAAVSTQSSVFSFRHNGTSSAGLVISCAKGEPSSGYVIEIKSTGSTRTFSRGYSSGGRLTSCNS